MTRVTLFTGYDRSDLLEALPGAGFPISRVVVPQSPKYLPAQANFIAAAILGGVEVRPVRPSALECSVQEIADPEGILLSAGYPFLIPSTVASAFRFAVNVHPTLLPRHRGKYLNWVLLDAEGQSGVTVHLLSEVLDGGAIVAQESFDVTPFDTLESLKRKSRECEPGLVTRALRELVHGTAKLIVQDEDLATTHVGQRTPKDSEMPPEMSLADALNVVRASHSTLYPAYFVVHGQRVRVRMDRLVRPEDEFDLI